jgi:hypothetical protein
VKQSPCHIAREVIVSENHVGKIPYEGPIAECSNLEVRKDYHFHTSFARPQLPRSLNLMDDSVAIPANRLKVIYLVRPSVRSIFAVMNLQRAARPAARTAPFVFL